MLDLFFWFIFFAGSSLFLSMCLRIRVSCIFWGGRSRNCFLGSSLFSSICLRMKVSCLRPRLYYFFCGVFVFETGMFFQMSVIFEGSSCLRIRLLCLRICFFGRVFLFSSICLRTRVVCLSFFFFFCGGGVGNCFLWSGWVCFCLRCCLIVLKFSSKNIIPSISYDSS